MPGVYEVYVINTLSNQAVSRRTIVADDAAIARDIVQAENVKSADIIIGVAEAFRFAFPAVVEEKILDPRESGTWPSLKNKT